jgi:ParB family chromosome partitioning protein
MSSQFQNDAIFWVEVEKIKPNPYQPRRDFNEERLRDLAESIRQYGVLQPLTVTRREYVKEDGGIKVEYELIAGERRHRASMIANLSQVPVIIRSGHEDARVKLELAIIENLQREDLNPIERAEAFDQLAQEFEFTHREIAGKIGKSREYVSNSMRLLKLPEKIKNAVVSGQMTEGHARPIMMLRDNPEEQEMLFKEVIHKGLTVREAEATARRNAQDKVRKKKNKINPETKKIEDQLSDTLGTRVKIEERDVGGKLVIDFFTQEDLQNLIKLMRSQTDIEMSDMMENYLESAEERAEQSAEETAENTEKNTAKTLGGMIAAARARQQKNEAQDSEVTAQVNDDFDTKQETEAETAEEAPTDLTLDNEDSEESVSDYNDAEDSYTHSQETLVPDQDREVQPAIADQSTPDSPQEPKEEPEAKEEEAEDENEIYSVSNFSI